MMTKRSTSGGLVEPPVDLVAPASSPETRSRADDHPLDPCFSERDPDSVRERIHGHIRGREGRGHRHRDRVGTSSQDEELPDAITRWVPFDEVMVALTAPVTVAPID